jgi:hypothetical protein
MRSTRCHKRLFDRHNVNKQNRRILQLTFFGPIKETSVHGVEKVFEGKFHDCADQGSAAAI